MQKLDSPLVTVGEQVRFVGGAAHVGRIVATEELESVLHEIQPAAPHAMIDVHWPRTAVDAWRGERVRLAGMTVHVPGTRRERLSVVAGNLRIHRLLDRWVSPGSTVIDVGANIGYNTIRAARRAGPRGPSRRPRADAGQPGGAAAQHRRLRA